MCKAFFFAVKWFLTRKDQLIQKIENVLRIYVFSSIKNIRISSYSDSRLNNVKKSDLFWRQTTSRFVSLELMTKLVHLTQLASVRVRWRKDCSKVGDRDHRCKLCISSAAPEIKVSSSTTNKLYLNKQRVVANRFG